MSAPDKTIQIASQRLMKRALDQVQKRAQASMKAESKKSYKRVITDLPSLIQVSGLAQAVAFTAAKVPDKNGAERRMILADLARCLEVSSDQDDDRAMKEFHSKLIATQEVVEYIRLTRRSQQALQYFKRFAVSVLGTSEEN